MQLGLVGYVKETEKSIRRALAASRSAIRQARKSADVQAPLVAQVLDEVEAATVEAQRQLDDGQSAQRDHLPGPAPGGQRRADPGAGGRRSAAVRP